MANYDRPREIIGYCLAPLELDSSTPAYKEAYARLEHVIKTYQLEVVRAQRPVAIDFSRMPTLTLNEEAHGQD